MKLSHMGTLKVGKAVTVPTLIAGLFAGVIAEPSGSADGHTGAYQARDVASGSLSGSGRLARTSGAARLRPSWGVNGQVYAVAVLNGTVFVGGDFTSAIGPTGATLPRENLAAFSLATGRPLRNWVVNTSDAVHALVAARGSLWVGGKFGSVNGITRWHLAEVSASDGHLRAFRLDTNGTVRALAVTDRALYAGGDFTTAGGVSRSHLVAASPVDGRLMTAFDGSADGTVWSLATDRSNSVLYVGGYFTSLSGRARTAIGALDPRTGRTRRIAFHRSSGPVYSVDVSADGSRVVAAVGGPSRTAAGNSILAWSASTGRRLWRVRLHGDGQAVDLYRKTVYAGFHGGYRMGPTLRLLAIDLRSGRVRHAFRPLFSGYFGVRAIAATGRGIVAGGDFTSIDAAPREGLTIFATPRWKPRRVGR